MVDSNPLDVFSWSELSLRLGIATVIGLLLGLDRELTGKEAGIRTHALVALSAAMIMVSSLMLTAQLSTDEHQLDPLRSIQGLSQALGFIAAGVIFVRGANVVNMTTAANIWVAAAIGIAAGCGQYRLVLMGAVTGFVLLTFFRLIERFIPGLKKDKPE
jgi:putative Mg2+ transporter-C (MgtC) family protein